MADHKGIFPPSQPCSDGATELPQLPRPTKPPCGRGCSLGADEKGRFTCQMWEEKQKINLESHVLGACSESGRGQKIPGISWLRGSELEAAAA